MEQLVFAVIYSSSAKHFTNLIFDLKSGPTRRLVLNPLIGWKILNDQSDRFRLDTGHYFIFLQPFSYNLQNFPNYVTFYGQKLAAIKIWHYLWICKGLWIRIQDEMTNLLRQSCLQGWACSEAGSGWTWRRLLSSWARPSSRTRSWGRGATPDSASSIPPCRGWAKRGDLPHLDGWARWVEACVQE